MKVLYFYSCKLGVEFSNYSFDELRSQYDQTLNGYCKHDEMHVRHIQTHQILRKHVSRISTRRKGLAGNGGQVYMARNGSITIRLCAMKLYSARFEHSNELFTPPVF